MRVPLRRRSLLQAGAIMLATPALAQGSWPDRPIRLLIPWPPGASADVFLRALADQAGRRLGQPVVPENRPGASGSLGAAALKDARPDGYTLAQIHTGVFRAALAADRPTYDALHDFSFIIQLSGSVHGLVVRSDSPWQTIRQFFDHVRANPGRVTYGTLGPTSIQHIAMLEVLQYLNAEMTHIPYRGGGELYTGLLSRQVDSVVDASGWAPMVADGQFRLLVVFGSERMARFPDVPTLRQAGIPMDVNSPYGLGAPRGTDPAIIARLHDAFKEALFDPTTQEVMGRYNMPNLYLNTADYDAASRRQHVIERENLIRLNLLPAGR